MSSLYVIAGPPGVGKTTLGEKFVDPDLDIINEDDMRFKYKELGYPDYQEHAIHRVSNIIRSKLIRNEDFAYELNLGYPEHYEYILSAKRFNFDNKLHVILFHTDELDLCLERAELRYQSGRHLVKPQTVREMYNNTIPLLKANFDAIDHLILLDATRDNLLPIATYQKKEKSLEVSYNHPVWFKDDLLPFIQNSILNVKPENQRDQNDIGFSR